MGPRAASRGAVVGSALKMASVLTPGRAWRAAASLLHSALVSQHSTSCAFSARLAAACQAVPPGAVPYTAVPRLCWASWPGREQIA